MAASRHVGCSFNHSCLRTPLHPLSRMPSPGYERAPGELPARPASSGTMRGTPSPARLQPSSRSSRVNSAKSRASSATATAPPRGPTLTSLLTFYESIPDHSDLQHLSDREFYRRVQELRLQQQAYVSSLSSDPSKGGTAWEAPARVEKGPNWSEGVKGVKCVLNDSRGGTPLPHSPLLFRSACSSARSGCSPFGKPRPGSVESRPEVWANKQPHPDNAWLRTRPDLSAEDSPLSSPCIRAHKQRPKRAGARAGGGMSAPTKPVTAPPRTRTPRASSARRTRGQGVSARWDSFDELVGGSLSEGELLPLSQSEMIPLSLHSDSEDDGRGLRNQSRASPRRPRSAKNVAWREPQFTVPQPFRMTRREEEDRYFIRLRRELLGSDDEGEGVEPRSNRTHEVPLTSRLPLYHNIMLQQELRREKQKRHSKARLLSKVRPFSFDDDLGPPHRPPCRHLSKSSPELRDLARCRGGGNGGGDGGGRDFRARPMPHHLFSGDAYVRRREDEYFRALQRRIRAEELLRASSLPPSMAARSLLMHEPCARHHDPDACDPPSRQHSAPVSHSPATHQDPRDGLTRSRSTLSPYEPSASRGGKQKQRPSSAVSSSVSPIRQNLAAVLRIESCRRRAEREMALQREHRRQLEEARVRARVLRRRPAWKVMTQGSTRRELALRALTRQEEERSRQQDHSRSMGRMMGRVLGIPTLFERQAQETLKFRVSDKSCMEVGEHFVREVSQAFNREVEEVVSSKGSSCKSLSSPEARKFVAPSEAHITFSPSKEDREGDEKKDDQPEISEAEKMCAQPGNMRAMANQRSQESQRSAEGSAEECEEDCDTASEATTMEKCTDNEE